LEASKQLINDFFSLSPASVDLWWANVAIDEMTLTLVDKYAPFIELAEINLRKTLYQCLTPSSNPVILRSKEFDSHIKDIMETLNYLDLNHGGKKSCQLLKQHGWTLYCLTNGSEEDAQALLERRRLIYLFDGILTCNKVRRFKPHSAVYKMLETDVLGSGPKGKWLISSHAYDVAGAIACGFDGIFINDNEPHYNGHFPKPNHVTHNIRLACDYLLNL